jgi:hypothetical protein
MGGHKVFAPMFNDGQAAVGELGNEVRMESTVDQRQPKASLRWATFRAQCLSTFAGRLRADARKIPLHHLRFRGTPRPYRVQ